MSKAVYASLLETHPFSDASDKLEFLETSKRLREKNLNSLLKNES